ncbi:MAG TPA: dihydrofolate reductase family protein [Thermoplasmata archaeon]|jgi:2,5-diamino-6-(ribosylamino)-4(3H)-pyrimidinone 5'-phosphate reductase|nr:dihydrofolate reductase family protein [Thermoplasmata archaeon]
MAVEERPEVLVNCAISLDGRLAYAGGRRARLSGPEDLARVQWLRADVDGIVVGVGTVLIDDPSLRVHWEMIDRPAGRAPARIVLDSNGRTPAAAKVLDGSAPTLMAVSTACDRTFPPGVEVVRAGTSRVELPALFAELHRRGMRKILVEGGAEVLASVLRSGTWDRLTVYVASVGIGGPTAPPMLRGPDSHDGTETVSVEFVTAEPIDDGVLLTYRPPAPRGPARPLSGGGRPARSGTDA